MIKRVRETDVDIGRRIRVQRLIKGMSQTELANLCGVTFQQIQKYEKGANRVSGSRMQQIASALGVTPAAFFGYGVAGEEEAIGGEIAALLTHPGAIQLLRNHAKLPPPLRSAIVRLTAELAGDTEAEG